MIIREIKLKFGRAADLTPETISVLPITVFVGPNNSGKSKILNEIYWFCMNGEHRASNSIIESIELTPTDIDKIEEVIQEITLDPEPNDHLHANHIAIKHQHGRAHVNIDQAKTALLDPNKYKAEACQWFIATKTLILNGNNRINLINDQSAGNLQKPPQTSFQVLFKDNQRREKLSKIIHEAFGKYLVIDPTNLGNLSLRLSSRKPNNETEEKGIHDAAVEFHKNALPISTASDGVKAFTGMITEMIAGDPSVLLMDEPEAFLHPSLSFKLGKEVSEIMSHSEKRLFVATHSPNFVMGCIQSGTPVNIVRLTYRDGIATSRILPNAEILKFMRNPLLRSTGVLSGLFYEFVVVTESDADRAFYQEINERLLKHSDKGIPNCLFLHAQNKQTIQTIIKPLRKLGIPVAGIVDIDILKEGGSTWMNFLDCGFLPELEKEPLANLRQQIMKKFEQTGKNMKRDGGIKILDTNNKEALTNLFSKLAEYGLFVVPNGELESWLPHLNATGHGPSWLVKIFELMGEDPNSETYIKPENNDVWSFIENISQWFFNAKRKGIPQ